MDLADFIWGAIVIATGLFISVYGSVLFKFALAATGFGIGFVGAWALLDSQEDIVRVLVAMAAGAVVGIVLYALARFGLYIAGGILGLIIAILIAGLLDAWGHAPSTVGMWILAVAGVGAVGFFGNRLGNLIIILATSAAGAFLILVGLQVWFADELQADIDQPAQALAQQVSLSVFLVVFALAALSQINSRRLMQRVLN